MDKDKLRELAEAASGGREWYHHGALKDMFEETGRKHYSVDAPFISSATPSTIIALLDEIAAKDAEIKSIQSSANESYRQGLADGRDEAYAMHSVVKAAVDWAQNYDIRRHHALRDAVRAYEAKMKDVGE